ncbi:hypothetical protein CRV15_08410 [Streptomyces clavuligerus]|uniref:Uncharacterized protein n=1 Tax=Streptomyces clavuligerus TaxID=1901 RepID=B5GQ45_STRCL|nr:hypothetical protein D1794_08980 [Streptomyces clavuligerus]EDY48441.1 hypothetical protein SSCG_01329 [Streptomyces clavuligerus]EFG09090.1 Hypothetical protein SCLAV_4016 [Streptomyces clavuligerus]QCS09246.1 hypothetical protein CRV15_08410 [Streptomyces clavuligerus]QPJ96815.1 hypothetical protein GE265_19520 [Streptomyces clavuligerus]
MHAGTARDSVAPPPRRLVSPLRGTGRRRWGPRWIEVDRAVPAALPYGTISGRTEPSLHPGSGVPHGPRPRELPGRRPSGAFLSDGNAHHGRAPPFHCFLPVSPAFCLSVANAVTASSRCRPLCGRSPRGAAR